MNGFINLRRSERPLLERHNVGPSEIRKTLNKSSPFVLQWIL